MGYYWSCSLDVVHLQFVYRNRRFILSPSPFRLPSFTYYTLLTQLVQRAHTQRHLSTCSMTNRHEVVGPHTTCIHIQPFVRPNEKRVIGKLSPTQKKTLYSKLGEPDLGLG